MKKFIITCNDTVEKNGVYIDDNVTNERTFELDHYKYAVEYFEDMCDLERNHFNMKSKEYARGTGLRVVFELCEYNGNEKNLRDFDVLDVYEYTFDDYCEHFCEYE